MSWCPGELVAMGAKRGLYGVALAALTGAGGCHLILGLEEPRDGCVVNGMQNDNETGVDCGGSLCGPCPDGEGCLTGKDCESLVCVAGTCRAPACDDEIRNGHEVDVDCGSASGCPGCADGRACDGHADCASGICEDSACVSHFVWARQFGYAHGPMIAVGPSGGVVLTAIPYGSGNLGGGPLSGSAMAIASYDPSGNHIWSRNCGNVSEVGGIRGPVVDPQGDVLVAGVADSTLDFGGGPLPGSGIDGFVAKLRGDGTYAWAKRFDLGSQLFFGGSDGATGLYVGGASSATIDLGGGPLPNDTATFIGKFDATGDHVWSIGHPHCTAWHLTRTLHGVAVAGWLDASVDFGGGPLAYSGKDDHFLLALTSSGAHAWSRSFSVTSIAGIEGDGAGNLVVVGAFRGILDFGGGPLVSAGHPEVAVDDIFIVKFDPTGQHLWSKRFGGVAEEGCSTAALDVEGGLVLGCTSAGGADFGNGLIHGTLMLKLDRDGNYVWSKSLSNSVGELTLWDMAVESSGHVLLVGNLQGTFDIGGGPMTSQSGGDLVIAKFLVP